MEAAEKQMLALVAIKAVRIRFAVSLRIPE